MNKKTKISIVIGLIIIALFLNPQDIYQGYKGKKEVTAMSSDLLEMLDLDNREVNEIHSLGDNIFLLKTDQESFLVQREHSNGLTEFTIYEKHDTTIGRYDGLKPSLSYRIKAFFSR